MWRLSVPCSWDPGYGGWSRRAHGTCVLIPAARACRCGNAGSVCCVSQWDLCKQGPSLTARAHQCQFLFQGPSASEQEPAKLLCSTTADFIACVLSISRIPLRPTSRGLGLWGPKARRRDGDTYGGAGKCGADDATWFHRLVDRTAGAPLPAGLGLGVPAAVRGHRQ